MSPVPKSFVIPLIGFVVIVTLILGFILWKQGNDRQVVRNDRADANLKVETQGRAADINMSERAAQDNQNIVAAREEFNNATVTLPPKPLSPRQRVDACEQLRRQGESAAILASARCV